jgi:hypothetical protein
VYALRVLTHQCLGWGRDENAVELATPTFTLLSQILQRAGQATATSNEG